MKLKFNKNVVLLVALMTQIVFAQEKVVSGVVSDNSGLPLPGVSVLIKGTTDGTQTDADGKYSIQVPPSQTLVFSYMGMKTQEIKSNSATINIKLMSETVELEGIVVTALGIKREKKALGYSSQQVTNEQINRIPTTNFVNNLAGKVAGLEIKQGTNFAGSTNVVLRGYKSILGDNQALFVIDGVPMLNSNINKASQRNG